MDTEASFGAVEGPDMRRTLACVRAHGKMARMDTLGRRPALTLLLLALAFGCEAPVMAGLPCSLSSDCSDPLVCREGHCVIECISQRDCIRGAHCAVLDGVGRCQIDVPLDTTSSPCGRGRVCFDASIVCRQYTCWNACTTGAMCAADSICRQGVCANPDSPGTSFGVHVACDAAHPCAEDSICARHAGAAAACYRTCTADAGCADIAATALCAEIEDPSLAPHTTACVIGCDPVRQRGCLGTNRCEINTELTPGPAPSDVSFFECRGNGGTSGQGQPCGTTTPDLDACSRGLGCVFAGVDGAQLYQCRRYCISDGDCMDATLRCTGAAPVARNADVAGGGALHVCVPAP